MERAATQVFDMAEIDVLFLRNDPSLDAADRPWATAVGALFGRLAVLLLPQLAGHGSGMLAQLRPKTPDQSPCLRRRAWQTT